MAEKFKFDQFFDFEELSKNIKKTSDLFKDIDTQIKELAKQPKIKLFGNTEDIKKNAAATEKLLKLLDKKEKADKLQLQTLKTKEQLEQAQLKTAREAIATKEKEKNLVIQAEKLKQAELKTKRDVITTEQKEQKQKEQLAKATKKQAEETMSLVDILKLERKTENQLATQNRLLRKAKKEVDITTKAGIKTIKQLNAQIDKNNVLIRKNTDQLGKQKINIGNYKSAIGGALSAITPFTLGIGGAVLAFREFIGISIDFEKSLSKLKAISGASNAEIVKLKANSLSLGATTAFTATEVNDLSTELAKLGFSANDIIKSTESIIDLAASTEDVVQSATVAGGIVKAFGFEVSEIGRVADVMALSFSSSALDLEKFQETMKLVAPIAKQANISLELTTALAGNLADSMLSGSIAGTGLKNLLSKLSDENSALSKELGFTVKGSEDLIKAFKILQQGNIDLTKATELTDERSKAAFLTLINGIDSVEGLTTALEGAEGAAAAMADTMLDNLAGDIKIAGSAWEGFILGIESGNGIINKFLRGAVRTWTKLLGGLTAEMESVSEGIKNERLEVNKLTIELTNSNTSQERRNAIYEELKNIQPDIVEGIDKENISTEILIANVRKFNELTIKRIALADTEEKLQDQRVLAGEATSERIELELQLLRELNSIRSQAERKIKDGGKISKEVQKIALSELTINEKVTKSIEALGTKRNRLTTNIIKVQSDYNEALKKEEEATKEVTSATNAYILKQELLFGVTEETTAATVTATAATATGTDAKATEIETLKTLNTELSALNETYNTTNVQDKKSLATTKDQIEALQERIRLIKEGASITTKLEAEFEIDEGFDFDIPEIIEPEITVAPKIRGLDPIGNLFDLLLGDTDLTEDQLIEYEDMFRDSFESILDSAKVIFEELNQLQIDRLETQLDVIQQSIEAEKDNERTQRDLAEAGKANSLEDSEAKLVQLRKEEAEKQKAIEEAEKRQRTFATIQVALSELVAAAKLTEAAAAIFAANSGVPFVGVALAAAAAASMVAGFIAIKSQIEGLHDGTDFVEGAHGYDNAGVFKLERGERVVNAETNKKIPRNVSNNEIPDLVKTALSMETMKTPSELLTFVQGKQPENKETLEMLRKMYESQLNREEFTTINGRSVKIIFRKGKEYRRIYIN